MITEDGTSTIVEFSNESNTERGARDTSTDINAVVRLGETRLFLPGGVSVVFPSTLNGSIRDVLSRLL